MDSRRRRQKNTIRRQLLDVAKGLTVNLEARIRKGLKGDTFHCLNAFQEAYEVKRFRHVFIGSEARELCCDLFPKPRQRRR